MSSQDGRTTFTAAGPSDIGPEGRLGPYRLIREIGHGGMGTVYLGVRDDDAFQKRVAIKVLKRGMDTEGIVRRFRHELQAAGTFTADDTQYADNARSQLEKIRAERAALR